MPYSTPSVSQYLQIRRLQTDINGKLANTKDPSKETPSTYRGYAGTLLTTLPLNALLSNKFLPAPPRNTIFTVTDWIEATSDTKNAIIDPTSLATPLTIKLENTGYNGQFISSLVIQFDGTIERLGCVISGMLYTRDYTVRISYGGNKTQVQVFFDIKIQELPNDINITSSTSPIVLDAIRLRYKGK